MASAGLAFGDLNDSITTLLTQLSAGNRDVEARLTSPVYEELRSVARHFGHYKCTNHRLQSTALVHEAYPHLFQKPRMPWQNRPHFFEAPSQPMQHILACVLHDEKRAESQHLVALDGAIRNFFGGRSLEEIALA